VEQIPDADFVYMRAHRNLIPKGVIEPGVFREQDGSMSVDWDRYSSPQITRLRARKNPEANAVLKMNVGGIRGFNNIQVEHAPIPENQAHTDVFLPRANEDLTEARYHLVSVAKIEIPFDFPLSPPATHS
jgi:hypothetical protein